MFKKKNRKNHESGYLLSSFDRLEHRIVNDRSELLDLCNVLLENRALLANFEKLSVDKQKQMCYIKKNFKKESGNVHLHSYRKREYGSYVRGRS